MCKCIETLLAISSLDTICLLKFKPLGLSEFLQLVAQLKDERAGRCHLLTSEWRRKTISTGVSREQMPC